ncbi:MAG: transcriptional regulator NrdR [Acidobacteriota bacterium]
MRCPFCGWHEDRVVDSREAREGTSIRRRRECLQCTRRFTSYERIEEIPCMVVKKEDAREAFDREKLLAGLRTAAYKRPIPQRELEAIVEEIETTAATKPDREISSREIGEMVMKRLADLDQVAYVRFASVYRSFQAIGDFVEEVRDLLDRD